MLNHHAVGIVDEGLVGLSATHRDATFGGFVFTVPAVSKSLAPFVYERFHLGAFNLEAALRLNYDMITPVKEKKDARIGHIRERSFTTWSASVSALYPLTAIVRLGANVSRSSRVPTIEELYSEGPHLAAYSYEVGNPDLASEHGIGTELFVTHKFDGFTWTLTTFRNTLTSYIIPRNSGEINYSTFLPIYRTVGVEALLYGVEGQLEWEVGRHVLIDLSAAYTHGSFSDSGDPLPQIPPLKARGAVSWKSGDWHIGLSVDAATAQHRVDTFEEATAGYAVVNAFVQYTRIAGGLIHNVSLNGDNLFDREYRNHLSRVKSILPEAGINLRATYKLHFALF
jgi:iron complex outermembrane recepter protein